MDVKIYGCVCSSRLPYLVFKKLATPKLTIEISPNMSHTIPMIHLLQYSIKYTLQTLHKKAYVKHMLDKLIYIITRVKITFCLSNMKHYSCSDPMSSSNLFRNHNQLSLHSESTTAQAIGNMLPFASFPIADNK